MENNKEFTEQELYEISTDAYKQTHKLSYLLLHRALKSVLNVPIELTIQFRHFLFCVRYSFLALVSK